MILYIATTNPGKLRDFAIAAPDRVTIQPLPGLKLIPAPAEDESTFAGNAIVKALSYSLHAPGHIVLADDSGLEVDALHGAPGVRSARYADDLHFQSTSNDLDERNNLCLLHALATQLNPNRRARYLCVLAAARDGELLATGQGSVEGEILSTPRGDDGFGYDPLFYLPELHRTMAQLDPVTRLSLSHRGRALQSLLSTLAPVKSTS
jgi:XTP/dITP diphosphohydrolase